MLKIYYNTIFASLILVLLLFLPSLLQAYADRIDDNPALIKTNKENGKKYVTDVDYLQILKNNDTMEKEIAFKDQQEISNGNQVPTSSLGPTELTGQPRDNGEQSATNSSVNASKVYVTWQIERKVLTGLVVSSSDVFFAASKDNGQTFGTPIKLNNKFNASKSQIAVSGNNVYIIYITWQEG